VRSARTPSAMKAAQKTFFCITPILDLLGAYDALETENFHPRAFAFERVQRMMHRTSLEADTMRRPSFKGWA